MKTSNDLKQERHSLVTAQNDLINSVEARSENPNFTEDEQRTFDDNDVKIKALDGQIKRAEAVEDAKKRAAESAGAGAGLGVAEEKEKSKMLRRYDLHAAIKSQTRNGVLEGIEGEFHQELSKEARKMNLEHRGVLVPTAKSAEKRDASQTVTQDSGNFGGKLVFDDFGGVIEELTPNPVLRQMGARYFGGLSGDLVFVTDDGGIAATWEGETDTTPSSKGAYGQKRMNPKRLSATVGISLQNLMQSSIDLQRHTAERIRVKNELAIDTAGINGSGTGNVPMGILNAADVNSVSAGTNGGVPIWLHVVSLLTKIGESDAVFNADNLKYLINWSTQGKLQTTAHAANNAGYLMGSESKLNGRMTGVSSLVPNNLTKGSGTNLSAGICGDFSQQYIASWGFYDMVVDEITRKKEGVIEITTNQFLDILLAQPKAFARIKDWVTE